MEDRAWLRFATAVTVALIVLATIEMAARTLWPADRAADSASRQRGSETLELESDLRFVPDAKLLWRVAAATESGRSRFTINRGGFRGEDWPSRDERAAVRILVLGDGTPFGAGVPEGEQYPTRLQRLLDRAFGAGWFEIISAAVPGFSEIQVAELAREIVPSLAPDIVILHVGNRNEYEPAFDGHADERWIAAARSSSSRTPLRAIDVLASRLLDEDDREPLTESEDSVRQSQFRYQNGLSHLVSELRMRGCRPLIVEPCRATGRVGEEMIDTVFQFYRDTTRRVAAIGGVPYVTLSDTLATEPGAFLETSAALGRRGHAVVAHRIFTTFLTHSAFTRYFLDRITSGEEDPEIAYLVGTFGLLHTLYSDGPAAWPPEKVKSLLESAAVAETPLAAHAHLRWTLASWNGDDLAAAEDRLETMPEPIGDAESEQLLAAQLGALIRVLSGRPDEAVAHLDALEGSADSALSHLLLGMARIGEPSRDASRESFTRAVKIDPSLGIADLWRAKCHHLDADMLEARLHYRHGRVAMERHRPPPPWIGFPPDESDLMIATFLRQEPTLFGTRTRAAMGRGLLRLHIEAAFPLADPLTTVERALTLVKAGRIDEAAAELKRADADPGMDAETRLRAATMMMTRGGPPLRRWVRAWLDLVLAQHPSPDAAFAKGVVEMQDGQYADAVGPFEVATERDDPRAWYYLGECLLRTGEPERAAEALENALRHWPDHADVLKLLARANGSEPTPPE